MSTIKQKLSAVGAAVALIVGAGFAAAAPASAAAGNSYIQIPASTECGPVRLTAWSGVGTGFSQQMTIGQTSYIGDVNSVRSYNGYKLVFFNSSYQWLSPQPPRNWNGVYNLSNYSGKIIITHPLDCQLR